MSVFALLISLSVISGCHNRYIDKGFVTGQKHHANTATPNFGWWYQEHLRIVNEVKQGNVDMIFVGDSITAGWAGEGQRTWDKYYAPRNARNLGIGGDRTEHVLWRLQNGAIDGIAPKVAVVMIGTNNLVNEDITLSEEEQEGLVEIPASAEQTADGVIAICKTLQKKLPFTQILVLGIFPKADAELEHPEEMDEEELASLEVQKVALGKMYDRVQKTNQLISQIGDSNRIHYMDIGQFFLEKDGTLSTEIMPDLLHLNERGYKIWADAIEIKIKELMQKSEQAKREFDTFLNYRHGLYGPMGLYATGYPYRTFRSARYCW